MGGAVRPKVFDGEEGGKGRPHSPTGDCGDDDNGNHRPQPPLPLLAADIGPSFPKSGIDGPSPGLGASLPGGRVLGSTPRLRR